MNHQPTHMTPNVLRNSKKLLSRRYAMQMTTLFQTNIFFFNTAVTIHHCWVCFHLLAISQLNVATSKEVFLRQASFQSHLFNQPFGGGWSAHIMPATSVFNHVYPHSYMVLFFKEGERKKKKTLLYCFLLPRLISAFRCCTALKNHVIMSLFFSS